MSNRRSFPSSPRRSLLFTPGDAAGKIENASQLQADTVILDLEDAVTAGRKEEARRTTAAALDSASWGGIERLVRVNALATPFFRDDLAAVIPAGPDGLVIPKVETAADLAAVDQTLTENEQTAGLVPGKIPLFVLIETPLAVMNLPEIAQGSRRIAALLFGAEDLAAAMGSLRTQDGLEVFYARSAVVTAAAAYGLQAIDMVFTDLKDQDGLERETAFARQLGYTGKMALHPVQLPVINRVFTPSPVEIERAGRLLRAFDEHEEAGRGVFALDGRVIDLPLVRAARRIRDRARQAGLWPD